MTSNFEDVQSDPISASIAMLIPSAKAGPAMAGGVDRPGPAARQNLTPLRAAYELIKDAERWTQETMARDASGKAVNPLEASAVRWCASGAAVKAAVDENGTDVLIAAAGALFPEYNGRKLFGPVVGVNDDLGHEAVLQVFEKAIVEMEGGL